MAQPERMISHSRTLSEPTIMRSLSASVPPAPTRRPSSTTVPTTEPEGKQPDKVVFERSVSGRRLSRSLSRIRLTKSRSASDVPGSKLQQTFLRALDSLLDQRWTQKIVSFAVHDVLRSIHEDRQTVFDPDANEAHDSELRRFWDSICPGIPYARRSEEWKEIGFQGLDPATDVQVHVARAWRMPTSDVGRPTSTIQRAVNKKL